MPNTLGFRFWIIDIKNKSIHRKAPLVNHQLFTLSSTNRLTTNHKSKGFTLIELLIVIGIMGVIATISVASFSTAQIKARDSRRKADLDGLKKAIEIARSNNNTDGVPGCNPPSATCYLSAMNDVQNPALVPTYIKKMPLDPTGAFNYRYRPNPAGCSGVSGITICTDYSLEACLENDKEPINPPTVIAISGNICLGSGHIRQYSVFSVN